MDKGQKANVKQQPTRSACTSKRRRNFKGHCSRSSRPTHGTRRRSASADASVGSQMAGIGAAVAAHPQFGEVQVACQLAQILRRPHFSSGGRHRRGRRLVAGARRRRGAARQRRVRHAGPVAPWLLHRSRASLRHDSKRCSGRPVMAAWPCQRSCVQQPPRGHRSWCKRHQVMLSPARFERKDDES